MEFHMWFPTTGPFFFSSSFFSLTKPCLDAHLYTRHFASCFPPPHCFISEICLCLCMWIILCLSFQILLELPHLNESFLMVLVEGLLLDYFTSAYTKLSNSKSSIFMELIDFKPLTSLNWSYLNNCTVTVGVQ